MNAEKFFRIACLSDTHGKHEKVEFSGEIHLLLFAGDYSAPGKEHDEGYAKNFLKWLESTPAQYVVGIGGNHDFTSDYLEELSLQSDKVAWCDKAVSEIGGKWTKWIEQPNSLCPVDEIFASPISVANSKSSWANQIPRASRAMGELVENISPSHRIILTHGPAYGSLDVNVASMHLGCELLAQRLEFIKGVSPVSRLHVFGHIHEDRGVKEGEYLTSVNCAVGAMRNPRPIVLIVDSSLKVLDIEV
jgi:predicted phosphodiesterase